MLPIIDTHQHLWDLNQFNLPWLNSVPELNRSFRIDDYVAEIVESNVLKAIYMEVDVHPSQHVAEANYLIDICQKADTVTVGAVISGRPASSQFRSYIDNFKRHRYIKGIRQVLHGPETPAEFCLEQGFVRGVQYLGEVGLSFDLCLRPSELMDAVTLAKQCPDTQFIIDHCGNADPYIVNGTLQAQNDGSPYWHDRHAWMDAMSTLSELPAVVCKISGVVARAKVGWTPEDLAPTINHCLDAFGTDRVVFGGDWPVCTLGATYEAWGKALRHIISTRKQEDQRKLLYDNAERLYRLNE